MGTKNAKVMSDEEKKIISDSSIERKENKLNDERAVKRAQERVFEKEKMNLPILIEERMTALANGLANDITVKGLSAPAIYKLLAWQGISTVRKGYSASELIVAKEAYQKAVCMINEKVHYVPSISSFCAFVGISSATYKNYMQSPDEDKRDAILMIDDYIKGVMLDAATTRNADSVMATFRGKSEHGMTEANAPIVVEYRNAPDIEEIRRKVKGLTVLDAEFKENK